MFQNKFPFLYDDNVSLFSWRNEGSKNRLKTNNLGDWDYVGTLGPGESFI